jgi:hypothetical protein
VAIWESIWSEARVDFRLSEAEFRRMTPRQFSLLRKRRSAEHERQEFLLGIVNQSIVNFSMAQPKEPARATDFMPSRWANGEESDEDMLLRLARSMADGAITVKE